MADNLIGKVKIVVKGLREAIIMIIGIIWKYCIGNFNKFIFVLFNNDTDEDDNNIYDIICNLNVTM